MPTKTENLQMNIYSRNERVVDWLDGTDSNFQIIDKSIGRMLSEIERASNDLNSCVQLHENYGTRINIISNSFTHAHNTINNSQYSGGVLVENQIYIFDDGGYYIYDIKTNTFSFFEINYDLITESYCKNAYKFYFNGKIYFFGYDDTSVYTYHIRTDEFELADVTLPYKLKKSSFAKVNNKVYCFGSEYVGSLSFEYNLSHNIYTEIEDSPNLYDIPLIIDNTDTYVYLLGSTPYRFDLNTHEFTLLSIQGINKSDLAYSSMKNFGIILSGNSKEIYRFNSATLTIEKIDLELPYNLIGGTALYYKNNIYLFGGEISNNVPNQYFYNYIDY